MISCTDFTGKGVSKGEEVGGMVQLRASAWCTLVQQWHAWDFRIKIILAHGSSSLLFIFY
ncbi:hypothetical protein L484_008005 [Morus notabilis]|uniref:Uncharacterized protein n=1 Tax=Morus notabilis TaxID=981085 RepID=W9QT97_9ROSA|nr:hypothetical protein L484_008005 [Morus notabilis]